MRAVLFGTAFAIFALDLPAALAQGLPAASPESVGLSSARLQCIDAMVRRHVDEQKLAGAVVLVARRGRVAYFESFGVMDATTRAPLKRDAIFRIASMSKPLVSVAAMTLYEEGRLQLYDPVSRFVPELKGMRVFREGGPEAWTASEREMTIQDLLRHTSGLIYAHDERTPLDKVHTEAHLEKSHSLEDMIPKLRDLPLRFSLGEGWEYGRSTDVLGSVIQAVSSLPVDVFLRQRVLDPLHMADTDFFVPQAKHARLASLHGLSDAGALVVTDAPPTCEVCQKPGLLEPGAGLVSTASDYVRFCQFLLNRGELDGVRILGPKTVDTMTRNHVPARAMPITRGNPAFDWMVTGWGFGLGFRVLLDPVAAGIPASEGSFGWFGYSDTYFIVDPKEQLIGIFMAQFKPPPAYPGVREFENLVFQAVVD